jgi:hypothetical protein
MSHFGRGSFGWWEVMRGGCFGHFGNRRGGVAGAVRRKRAAVLGQLRPEEGDSQLGPMQQREEGWDRLGQPGGRGLVGKGRGGQLGWKGCGRGWVENRSWAKVQEIKSL